MSVGYKVIYDLFSISYFLTVRVQNYPQTDMQDCRLKTETKA